MFNEKVVGSSRRFSPADLLQYVELIVKESRIQERAASNNSNYNWLISKDKDQLQNSIEADLQDCKPLVNKVSPENCAAIAVKLDILTETTFLTANDITITFKKLLEDTITCQLLQQSVKAKKRRNKVHPQLEGRKPTVSFIL